MTPDANGAHRMLFTSTPQCSLSKDNGRIIPTSATVTTRLPYNGGVAPGQSVKLHFVEPDRSCDLTQ